jgi:protoporphyrinogen oxidase
MMQVGIIGAGPAGMAAAWELSKAGHQVTIFEAEKRVGGLAAGFKDEGWDWQLEKFYHHWFQSDRDILGLIEELGYGDQVLFPRPKTSMWSNGKAHLFDNPVSMLMFPNMAWIPKIRFGVVGLYLRLSKNWQWMERFTAQEWLIRYMGQRAYEDLWRPMLIGKFGDVYDKVTMAWFWARIHTRSTKLGTFQGGFQRFLDLFAERLGQKGVQIRLNQPVGRIAAAEKGLTVESMGQNYPFDAVISTASPRLLLKLAPDIAARDAVYAQKMASLQSMGAVVVVAALKHQLMRDGTYWLNLPASSPDKAKSEFPFVALCEHTNWLPKEHYAGDHLVYCGEYVPADHAYMTMPQEKLIELFLGTLKTFNPAYQADWVRRWWVFRAPYAQPIPFVNQSANIPALATPIQGLYSASMSQVYPWDRGTNYAVQIGKQVAAQVMQK